MTKDYEKEIHPRDPYEGSNRMISALGNASFFALVAAPVGYLLGMISEPRLSEHRISHFNRFFGAGLFSVIAGMIGYQGGLRSFIRANAQHTVLQGELEECMDTNKRLRKKLDSMEVESEAGNQIHNQKEKPTHSVQSCRSCERTMEPDELSI